MNIPKLIAGLIGLTALILIVTVAFTTAKHNIDRIYLEELTDNDPHFDRVIDRGQFTQHWPHQDQAEEAQR